MNVNQINQFNRLRPTSRRVFIALREGQSITALEAASPEIEELLEAEIISAAPLRDGGMRISISDDWRVAHAVFIP